MRLSLFDYHLPQSLIAQKQAKPRDHSRLLVLDRQNKKIQHKHFYDLPDILNKNDVLVVNETKVFPARLPAKKITGGQAEILLLRPQGGPSATLGTSSAWQAILGGRRLKVGDKLFLKNNLQANIIRQEASKVWQVRFNCSGKKLEKIINDIGHTPLPPYIKIKDSQKIKKDYQTIYARKIGSAAAPTAGLHFTPRLLKKLRTKGIKIYKITLHVGLGTFAPVEEQDIEKHKIHSEYAEILPSVSQKLNKAKKSGGRIIAVGTTTARTLEAFSNNVGDLKSGAKWVDIYIYPGYKFRFVDDLITNFHLPQSSLLFMVSALAGRQLILQTYHKAIKLKYRFFSFGDAMLITKNCL